MVTHIGIDIRPLLPTKTGIGEYTYELVNALLKEDTTKKYYLFYNASASKIELPRDWKKPNVALVHTRFPNKLFNGLLSVTKRPLLDQLITKKLALSNLDVFFSPHLNFSSFSKKVKCILTIHDLSFEFFPYFFSYKQRLWHYLINPKRQATRADIIITPSQNTKLDLINHYHIAPEKIQVLPLGLSEVFKTTSSPQSEYKNLISTPYILYLGTHEPRKNILGIIKAFELAFPLLPQKHTLIIAGSNGWKNKEALAYLARSRQKNYIRLLGYVSEKEKPSLYKHASLFVYPSFYEGFGLPVLEAMSIGIPVITSSHSSLPEITSQHAYLVNPHRPYSIAEGMVTILTNEKIKNHLVNGGQQQAQFFNWKKTAQLFLKIIDT